MPILLLVEDNAADIREAADMARRVGFNEIEICRFASDARNYLENGIDGKVPLPHAMLIDLELGFESGFELLRMWYGSQQLKRIPIIVWTIMGDQQREICTLFGVKHFVSKHTGSDALRDALMSVLGE